MKSNKCRAGMSDSWYQTDFFCLLGIPKGPGASFKFLDKERDKLKDSDEWPKPEEHVS